MSHIKPLFIYFIILILILSIIIFSGLAVTRQQSLLVLFSWFEKYLLNIYLKKKQPKKKTFEGKSLFFFSTNRSNNGPISSNNLFRSFPAVLHPLSVSVAVQVPRPVSVSVSVSNAPVHVMT